MYICIQRLEEYQTINSYCKMNKKLFTLLVSILSCYTVSGLAHTAANETETNQPIHAVKIYQVYNPTAELSDTNQNSSLSIRFARGDKMPQYLIMLNESIKQEENYLSARFLMNLKTRLAFVDGKLYDDGSLVIQNGADTESLDVKTVTENGEGEYSPALFSFRLIDDSEEQNFLIESWAKSVGSQEGEWVKMANGIPVAVSTTLQEAIAGKADIFNLGKAIQTKAGKETDPLVAELKKVSVTADYGTITIQGAEGKKVTITNTLGTVLTNETVHSNHLTLHMPTGVVLVSVDNQPAIKTLVK